MRPKYASELSPEYVLLGLLSQGPAHGYQLSRRLATDLGQVWRLSESQVHNVLDRLEAQGFVSSRSRPQRGRPRRRVFRLSPAGSRRFEKWLATPTGSSARAIRVEFITRLSFAHSRNPQLASKILEAQVTEINAGLEQVRSRLADLPPEQIFNRMALELRVRQLLSILDWLNDGRTRLVLGKTRAEAVLLPASSPNPR